MDNQNSQGQPGSSRGSARDKEEASLIAQLAEVKGTHRGKIRWLLKPKKNIPVSILIPIPIPIPILSISLNI